MRRPVDGCGLLDAGGRPKGEQLRSPAMALQLQTLGFTNPARRPRWVTRELIDLLCWLGGLLHSSAHAQLATRSQLRRDPAASDPPPISRAVDGVAGRLDVVIQTGHSEGIWGVHLLPEGMGFVDAARMARSTCASSTAGWSGSFPLAKAFAAARSPPMECRCLPASAMAFGSGGSATGTWSGKSPARGTGASRASRSHRTESASAPATGMARWLCGTTGLWKRRSASLGDSSARRGRSRSAPMASCSRPERTKGSSDSGRRRAPAPLLACHVGIRLRARLSPRWPGDAAASAHSGDPERRGDGNARIFDSKGICSRGSTPTLPTACATPPRAGSSSSVLPTTTGFWSGIGRASDRTIEIRGPPRTSPSAIDVSPGGTQIVAASMDIPSLRLFGPEPTPRLSLFRPLAAVHAVAYSPDHTLLAAGKENGEIDLRSTTGKLVSTLDGGPGWVTALAFSPDGKLLASAGDGLRVFTRSGELVRAMPGHRPQATQVHFSPDGRELVSGGRDGVIAFWNVEGGRLTHSFKALSPDGQSLLSGSDFGELVLWSWNGRRLHSLEGHGPVNSVYALAFAHDGRRVASAAAGVAETELLFHSVEGQLLERVPLAHRWLNMGALAFSPGDRWLAVSETENVRIFELASKRSWTLEGHTRVVSALAFEPEGGPAGGRLLSGSFDSSLRLWALENGSSVMLLSSGAEWLAITPDGYFDASPHGGGLVAMANVSNPGQSTSSLPTPTVPT